MLTLSDDRNVHIISKDDMINTTNFKMLTIDPEKEFLDRVNQYIRDCVSYLHIVPVFHFYNNARRNHIVHELTKVGYKFIEEREDKSNMNSPGTLTLIMDSTQYVPGSTPYIYCTSLRRTRDYVRYVINNMIRTAMSSGLDHVSIYPTDTLYLCSFFFNQWLTKELEMKGYTVSTGTDIGPNSFSSYKISWQLEDH